MDLSKRPKNAGCVGIVCYIEYRKSEIYRLNVHILRVYLLFQQLTFPTYFIYFIMSLAYATIMSVCQSTLNNYETLCEHNVTMGHPTRLPFNFRSAIMSIWRTCELVRLERHYHHLI